MRADDLQLSEIVEFSEGCLSLHGRRLVLHDIHSFAQFRKDLVEMVGLGQTRRILTRFGYFWGHADAAAMVRIFEWDSLAEWLRAGPRMHTLQGVVRCVVTGLRADKESGQFEMTVQWHQSGEADEHLVALGGSDEPVCWMLVGYASGYASFCMGRPIYFIEQQCRVKGDRLCTAVGRDEGAWGEALAAHRPYFQADDINGKIMALTEALKRKTRELRRERKRLADYEGSDDRGLVAIRSEAFRRVLEVSRRVARFDSSVLIVGESGVGKEVLARHIQAMSPRAEKQFLGVNCGALPESLLESELFGHAEGAFTGAVCERVGLFEQAAGGTLFLDEIGDVSPAMQLKLLRVLQEREVVRVGETVPRPIDVRVVAATNRNLKEAIRTGQFREDLYYRLSVVEIEVPPLRQREEDILSLARYFVKRLAEKLGIPGLRLDATCVDVLQGYSWPGNVRELENAIERAAILSEDGVIRPESLPSRVLHGRATGEEPIRSAGRSLRDVEREHIRNVLALTEGNRTQAAKILGISTATLWRKLKAEQGQ